MNVMALVVGSLFVSSVVMGMTGFGVAITAISILSFVLPVRDIVPLIFIYNFSMNVVLLLQLRAHIRLKRVLPQLIGFLPGATIGVYGLVCLPDRVLKIIVGTGLTVFAVWMILRRSDHYVPAHSGWSGMAGFFAGLLGGSVYMPGPPVIVYNTLTQQDRFAFKVDLQIFFLLANLYLLGGYLMMDLFTRAVLLKTLYYSPFVILGLLLGMAAFRRIPSCAYGKIVDGLIGVMGLLLLAKNSL